MEEGDDSFILLGEGASDAPLEPHFRLPWAARDEDEEYEELHFEPGMEEWLMRRYIRNDWRSLYSYLQTITPEQRSKPDKGSGNTFLHEAAARGEEKAIRFLLASGACDIRAKNKEGQTPMYFASTMESMKLLCAAGGNPYSETLHGETSAIDRVLYQIGTARKLLRMGVRLTRVNCDWWRIPLALREYESALLRCRSAAVALIRVKDKTHLWRWDRFLLKEIALQVWLMRDD